MGVGCEYTIVKGVGCRNTMVKGIGCGNTMVKGMSPYFGTPYEYNNRCAEIHICIKKVITFTTKNIH